MKKGFTLIELIIALAIAAMITAAIYFSLNTALDTWSYSKDQLALQKVMGDLMEEITSGFVAGYGLRDSVEITYAAADKVEFVPPWTDTSHTVVDSQSFFYKLSAKIKPGTATPIAEVKMPGNDKFVAIPIVMDETKANLFSQVRLLLSAPVGSQLRFTFHPDPQANPDAVKKIWWDSQEQQVYTEYLGEKQPLSKNLFDVKILEMKLRYFDSANNPVTESEIVDMDDLNVITGIEISLKVQLGQYTDTLVNFVNLRNSPLRSGYLPIKQDMRVPIPDSHKIHSLVLTNLEGVSNEDEIELEFVPKQGKIWRVKILFSSMSTTDARIAKYSIEYPSGYPVYSAFPKTNASLGLDLLKLDPEGRFDYDQDQDVEEQIILEAPVTMEVKRMDVKGAALFVRP